MRLKEQRLLAIMRLKNGLSDEKGVYCIHHTDGVCCIHLDDGVYCIQHTDGVYCTHHTDGVYCTHHTDGGVYCINHTDGGVYCTHHTDGGIPTITFIKFSSLFLGCFPISLQLAIYQLFTAMVTSCEWFEWWCVETSNISCRPNKFRCHQVCLHWLIYILMVGCLMII